MTDRDIAHRVMVVAPGQLAFDRNAGHLRLLNVMEAAVSCGARVGYVALWPDMAPTYADALRRRAVELLYETVPTLPSAPPSDAEILTRLYEAVHHFRPTHVWIFLTETAHRLIGPVRQMAPEARVIVDAVDLEYLAGRRALNGDRSGRAQVREIWKRDFAMFQRADVLVLDSDVHVRLARRLDPALQVHQIPLIPAVDAGNTDFRERSGALFIGTARHPPNVDAIRWYVRHVTPLLRGSGAAELRIVGENPDGEYVREAGPGVQVEGWQPDLAPYYATARVVVAPLRHGAGLRGKVIEAMSAGVPVVATRVASEGIQSRRIDDRFLQLAAEPLAFASAVLDCHDNQDTWALRRRVGRALVAGRFDRPALHESVCALLSTY